MIERFRSIQKSTKRRTLIFRIISNGSSASLVSVENLENEEKSKGFANAAINLKFSGVNVTSIVQGVAGNWQLFISREKQ